ncbi:DUF3298 and DUF4163 domain-containing protein [Halanaerobium praevalens]|uniref:Deacetylase PdaC domain-containing protein n=1 Tax=Halanaerobium praevalens (strain ATCC 33744 / DSM 2228 / GSL) TaxID=572479 RepID=E3DNE3_HALPG|nr:DUF3298 and DUF4163 domain-containing protein [Halanaerobium praevalens]ADO77562.1 hypothetical protein Hprae_1434 [Halanaerobium praevalens DSM 2228]
MKNKNYFFSDPSYKLITLILVILIFLISIPTFAVEIVSLPLAKTEKDLYQIEAKIPILMQMDRKEVQAKYNNLFRDNILEFVEYTIDLAQKNRVELAETDFPKREFVGKVDFDLKNKEQILSIKFNYYQYTGGAHGNPYSLTYNIDLLTGKDVKLVDFLKRNNLNLIEVENVIKTKINNNPDNYFQAEYGFQNLAEDQHYYLTENELVIYFQPYAIAPYSTGMPEFKIKY